MHTVSRGQNRSRTDLLYFGLRAFFIYLFFLFFLFFARLFSVLWMGLINAWRRSSTICSFFSLSLLFFLISLFYNFSIRHLIAFSILPTFSLWIIRCLPEPLFEHDRASTTRSEFVYSHFKNQKRTKKETKIRKKGRKERKQQTEKKRKKKRGPLSSIRQCNTPTRHPLRGCLI